MAKAKKCRSCGKEYQPFRSLQRVCSPMCAINLTRTEKKKSFKRETRKMKAKANGSDRGYQTKKAQEAFNKYIRLRDKNEPCISCGTQDQGIQYCAGHYKTRGAFPELRFEELNVHKQCNKNCNLHLSGNLIPYRINLIAKIGLDKVEWLESNHGPKKYTIDDLKEIKAKYNMMAREIENE